MRFATTIAKSEIIRAKKSTIYAVVANVNNYKFFVPFCSNSIMEKIENGTSKGTLEVKLGPLSQKWESLVILSDNEILAKNSTTFPLEFLNTRWSFRERKNGLTEVKVTIDYELSNSLNQFIPDDLIPNFSHQFVAAFKSEAEKIERKNR